MQDNRTAELELVIDGDPAVATTVLESCDIPMSRPKPTRFIAEATVIIGVATALVKLTTALIDLADRLRKDPQAPKVVARNVTGEQLVLNMADNDAIILFVRTSAE